MPVSSSTKASEPQTRPTGLLLAKFPLNDPVTTGFHIIIRQGRTLHTMKMSRSIRV